MSPQPALPASGRRAVLYRWGRWGRLDCLDRLDRLDCLDRLAAGARRGRHVAVDGVLRRSQLRCTVNEVRLGPKTVIIERFIAVFPHLVIQLAGEASVEATERQH